jgi:RNA polymerase sigma-54 factor
MALMQRLELRQGQSLVMTPQLQQAIKLLQMSNIELQAFVENELERNPLLERDERSEAQGKEQGEEPQGQAQPDMVSALNGATPPDEKLSALDTDLDNVYTHESRADAANRLAAGSADSGWSSLRPSGSLSLDGEGMEFGATLTREQTLAEHLTGQLNLAINDPVDRLIGQHLIGMVNESGYLTATTAAVAESLGTGEAHVERVLQALQGFDPPGVFARDLKECLAIQLKERDRFDPAMAALIGNLDRVARRDYAGLKAICQVDQDDIMEMIAELKALNPKPGHAFGTEPVQPVVPDVFVRAAPDGSWLVELNNETLPRILINNQYAARVSKTVSRDEDKSYISECHANASWLIRSLDQRAKTILKVAREIVRQQDAFLVLGIQHLRPINLKTVADAIEMHESTVSRVTSNKYVATTRGIFEMKYFFTPGFKTADGKEISNETVKEALAQMVANEDSSAPLSDQAMVEELKKTGITVARRTIAKYRDELRILPSHLRKSY